MNIAACFQRVFWTVHTYRKENGSWIRSVWCRPQAERRSSGAPRHQRSTSWPAQCGRHHGVAVDTVASIITGTIQSNASPWVLRAAREIQTEIGTCLGAVQQWKLKLTHQPAVANVKSPLWKEGSMPVPGLLIKIDIIESVLKNT